MNVLWFRRGLRFHDNPALLSSIRACTSSESTGEPQFFACYIFDTPTEGAFKPYHMHGFLLECLADLNENLMKLGSKLHVFIGDPIDVFRHLHSQIGISTLSLQHDSEPIYHSRDAAVKCLCNDLGITWDEHISHTLWDPLEIINANGGLPPLTYDMFLHVAMSIGDPPRPEADPNWEGVRFLNLDPFENAQFKLVHGIPSLEEIGVPEQPENCRKRRLKGGETNALNHLAIRLKAEKSAFHAGFYHPTQARPDILGAPLSLSSSLSLGSLSVRLFYWKVHDLFDKVNRGTPPAMPKITSQLIWREYFYTMSRHNPRYDKMVGNPICLQIPWDEDEERFEKWKQGKTGYPFIDAGQRQLMQEGWIHHTVRNAVAMFLTRGDLWLNWDIGAEYMAAQLVDSDWAVNSGNWMWVSSSAFEKLLDSSVCIDSVLYGKRLEPSGEYIRRYVPELAGFPFEYIHEPWKAPLEAQQAAGCIIGRDYPDRMVIHSEASKWNQQRMKALREDILSNMGPSGVLPPHCHPSSENEVYQLFCITEKYLQLS